MVANTAGQHRPTTASGMTVSVGHRLSPKVAVTPVWWATRSGSHSAATVATFVPSTSSTVGSASGTAAPAAIASTERMAEAASSVDSTGAPPSTVASGSVNRMVIQMYDSGTLSTTCSP